MIFSVQRYLEDYLERRQLRDVDQYSVALANLYAAKRGRSSKPEFQKSVRRIKTVFFRSNPALKRLEFERDLIARLDERFLKKKAVDGLPTVFPGGVAKERIRLRARRRSMAGLLQQFKAATEARAVDSFWVSRKRGELRSRPERIAQALLGVFFRGVLADGGFAVREAGSGIGFVDLVAVLSRNAPHIIEMKVLRGQFEGAEQLDVYMRQEGRQVGWLVVMDARRQSKRAALPATVPVRGGGGVVLVVVVELNPTAPSKGGSSSD